MRKATLVSGVIAAAIIFIGTAGKFLHLTGSSILLSLGVVLLMLSFLPLLLIYRIKKDTTVFQKITSVFGFIIGWLILFPGLLFSVQRWPGGTFLVLLGIIGGLIFLVLFFVSNSKAGTPVSPKSPFNVIVSLILITLFTGRYFVREALAADTEKNITEYETAYSAFKKIEGINKGNYVAIVSDSSKAEAANQLEKETSGILNYINGMRGHLISIENGIYIENSGLDTLSIRFVERPTDYDNSTHFMIGSDPANVTGESKLLKEAQIAYYNYIPKFLPEQSQNDFKKFVKQFLPGGTVVIDKDGSMTEFSWEQETFYHKTIIETLTALIKIETNILKAESEALKQINNSSPTK